MTDSTSSAATRSAPIRKASDRLAETALDDEVVLMNIDTGHFHALKGTGLAVWHLLDGTRDQAAICAALCASFAVDEERCQTEVAAFLHQMVEAGFVEPF